MSGFFSLEPGIGFSKVHHHHSHHHNHQHQDHSQNHPHHQHQEHDDNIISPYSLYLFKNEEINGRNFEAWQQYYHHQQQQQQHHQQPPSYGSSSGGTGSGSGSKLMRQGGYGGGSGGGMNCQDCGNQAKKDCQHMRCRTCCKSRGLPCQTHVKSTWVPAAKRRERQQQLMSLTQHNSATQQLSLMMRGSGSGSDKQISSKRVREDDHQQRIAVGVAGGSSCGGGGGGMILPQHHNTSSEVGNFPAEVSSPAVFRCVRVSAMDEAEEQLAYQTALSIGGHVFKGILYDHGPESRYHQPGEGSSSGGIANLQQLNLATLTPAATETSGINPTTTFIDPSSTYTTPFSAFMAGTQFFPPPRS